MNAKKIMGAVLVALLAAALFVGAGAADDVDMGIFTTYTDLASTTLPSTSSLSSSGFVGGETFFAADGTSVSLVKKGSEVYFAVDGDALNKQYSAYGITFKLVAPTAVVAALDGNGVNFIGHTVSEDVANAATTTYPVVTAAFSTAQVVFIDEDGVRYSAQPTFTAGKWGVAANLTGQSGLVTSAAIMGQTYYFTVSDVSSSITAAKDTVNIGNSIVINVYLPGQTHATIEYDTDKVTLIPNQEDYDSEPQTDQVKILLGLDGTGSIAFKADTNGKATFKLVGEDAKVTVTIEKGVITAVADADSFFVGNPILLSGTTTAGDKLYFYIEGQNFPFTYINPSAFTGDKLKVANGEWTVEIDSTQVTVSTAAGVKTLIAGTYPVIVSIANPADYVPATDGTLKEYAMSKTYGTAAITLTQPFITGVDVPGIVVQGTEYKITGTAYATENVKLYIFGTNYFYVDNDFGFEEEQFEFTLPAGLTNGMAVGTYFYLIQHPMKDQVFNVWNGSVTIAADEYAGGSSGAFADFYYAATQDPEVDGTFIFNAFTRGTNYAAQALLEEIAGQNIDDIFVQGVFEVEAQKLTINPIPAEVAKGTALTISGYTNSGEGVEVIVNVLAGKFGATVKGDENAALFLTAKAVTKEDGTFEATIDTSKLELGNYIVTVEIDGTQYDSAAVAIVDKAPVTPPADDKPDTPVTPPADDKPTEPETPGFGALAALAGLGAVAVLLLRRE